MRKSSCKVLGLGVVLVWASSSQAQTAIPDQSPTPDKPKPPGPAEKPPQPTPKPRSGPAKPAPTPEEVCQRDGGQWDSGECVTREKCEKDRKGEWAPDSKTCRCPAGKQRYGTICVEVQPSPMPPSPEESKKVECQQQRGNWTGTDCDTRQRDCENDTGRRWDPGKNQCIRPTPPPVEPPTPVPTAAPRVTSGSPPVPPPDRETSSGWRTTSLVVGGALVVTGAVAGLVAFSKRGSWASQCDAQKQCPASAKDDWETGNTAATVSTWTLVAGIPLTLVGLLWPSSSSSRSGAVSVPTLSVGVARTGTTLETAWRF